MKANKVMAYLEEYFPLSLQMGFDKCGLQVGSRFQEVNQVYIALNADLETLQSCIDQDCQMLITHHPFLLETITNIDSDQPVGRFIELAMQHHIVVYSLHTCLDRGQNGISMNDWLMQKLDVCHIECYDDAKIGKKAIFNQPQKASDLIETVKSVYHLPFVKYAGDINKEIKTIALCGGSAADDLEYLVGQVDCYITGDSKYRHAKYAIDHDILLIDAGHHLEVIFEEKMQALLKPLDISLKIHQSLDYFQYL